MDGEETRSLMDSETELEEIDPLGNFRRLSSRPNRKRRVTCPICVTCPSCLTPSWRLLPPLLIMSLVLNLIFVAILLIYDLHTPPSTEISPPSGGPHQNKLSAMSPYNDQLLTHGVSTPSWLISAAAQSRFRENLTNSTSPVVCGSGPNQVQPPRDNSYFNIFQDLSSAEISAVSEYLLRNPSLNINHKDRNGNKIFGIELHVPEKKSAVGFLDNREAPPVREALVTIEFHRETPRVVKEFVVGPLPHPTYHLPNPRMRKHVPLDMLTHIKMPEVYQYVRSQMTDQVHQVLRESFGVSVDDCDKNSAGICLVFLTQKVSFGFANRTTFTMSTCYSVEFPTIHPVPFQLIVSEKAPDELSIHAVYYGGVTFDSLQELVMKYTQGVIRKVHRTPPSVDPAHGSIPGSMNLRGDTFPYVPHAPPRQYEPQGPRYSVQNQHVRYLQWSFNVRMSVASGPQVWDVRWGEERVVYELSLQEVAVLYAGANPTASLLKLSDSAFGLGDATRGLVPGVDCPDHATYLPVSIFNQRARDSPYTSELPNALCIFEHNTGVPLRRHRRDAAGKSYYGGLVDYALIMRTIIVEFNYDYIFDFVFHSNGALETRAYATGYIMSEWFHYGEDPFGFRVHDDIVGLLHHHLFHFKLDMDVGGPSNRYETLDMTVDERQWPWLAGLLPTPHSSSSSSAASLQQISFRHNIRRTEREAVKHSDVDRPMYHIFYNDQNKNKFGNPRAYRLEARGYSGQILPDAHPALRSRKWANYPMGVTKRKEEEDRSSSIFSMFDANDPVRDFESYILDNDDIVDQDLVAWVTLGFYHIPHTEDIPNTPTVGTKTSILLLPFNYFPEDPSMGSQDAMRAERNQGHTSFSTYGTLHNLTCMPRAFPWFQEGNF